MTVTLTKAQLEELLKNTIGDADTKIAIPMSVKPKVKRTVMDVKFNEYFRLLMYSAFEDYDAEDPNGSPIDAKFQTYANLSLKKPAANKTARVVSSPEGQQLLTYAFVKMLQELKNVALDASDKIEIICEKLINSNSETDNCFASIILSDLCSHLTLGAGLLAASDVQQRVRNQIIEFLPQTATAAMALSYICNALETFLKKLAFVLTAIMRNTGLSMNDKTILSAFMIMGFDRSYVEEMRQTVPVKEKRVTKPKATKASNKVDTITATSTSEQAAPDSNEENEDEYGDV
jgi:hypothetical protein